MGDIVKHHGAGAARLRQKQALDLIALRTELFECVIADAAVMPVEGVRSWLGHE